MFLTALFIAFKFVLCIVSVAGAVGLLAVICITIGVFPIALFKTFPVVGIVIGILITATVVYFAARCINLSVKERKRKELYKTAKENCEKRLKETSEEQK